MDELVMNFLVHEGYKEGALMFAQESGAEANIDADSIDSRVLIRKLILKGDIEEAIKEINELNPEVSQNHSGKTPKLLWYAECWRMCQFC